MYRIVSTKTYKKSLQKLLKSGRVNLGEVEVIINLLGAKETLPIKYRDHKLTGELDGYRDCHIKPDILLFYKIHENELVLLLADIGSHSQLFG